LIQMKVFLSWSGQLSQSVALVFRDWLPQVLNKVEPYLSSEDIDKGDRWASDIARELEASSFGIIFVTASNLREPWINFEAGALSRTIDRAQVVPFLFGLKRSDVVGPLLQFQSTLDEEQEIRKLVETINRRLGDDQRPEAQLQEAFRVWYPELQAKISAVMSSQKSDATTGGTERREPAALLEEILDLVRNQQKLLHNSEGVISDSMLSTLQQMLPHREILAEITRLGNALEDLRHTIGGVGVPVAQPIAGLRPPPPPLNVGRVLQPQPGPPMQTTQRPPGLLTSLSRPLVPPRPQGISKPVLNSEPPPVEPSDS
jgi:TIR domain